VSTVRAALPADFAAVRAVYAAARRFMAENGNPGQWAGGYPPDERIAADIAAGYCRVICGPGENGAVHGVFALVPGPEASYATLTGGQWANSAPYWVIHRLAADGALPGVFAACLAYCRAAVPCLRVDTHADNRPMQHLLEKNGFVFRGGIVIEDGTPRIAYEELPRAAASPGSAAARGVVGRFAPSPSGRMHLGNLACCLIAWLSAKSRGGRIVLRIEDLDAQRCPREYADALERDLDWLGLGWDEGGSAGGPCGPYYQSDCAPIYDRAYAALERQGLLYPCFCSRSALHAPSAPHRSDGDVIYPGTCRRLTAAEAAAKRRVKAPAARLIVPDETISFTDGHLGFVAENLARECGDFVVRRGDGVYAYQLAVTVDDARMGVTEVVRGADLLSSTPRQLYLYRLLGAAPPAFYHVPLLLAPGGRRLSKRDGDDSLENLRGRYSAAEIIGRLAYVYGLQPEPAPALPERLISGFRWGNIPYRDVELPEGLF
jgi:glutamyl-tRNA synthetase